MTIEQEKWGHYPAKMKVWECVDHDFPHQNGKNRNELGSYFWTGNGSKYVKMMNQFPKIDGSAPLKIAIFVGPKDTPLMDSRRMQLSPLRSPLSRSGPLSVLDTCKFRCSQLKKYASDSWISQRNVGMSQKLRDTPDEDSCCFLPKSPNH